MDFLFAFHDRFEFRESVKEVRSYLEEFSDKGTRQDSALKVRFREDDNFDIVSWRFMVSSRNSTSFYIVRASGRLIGEESRTVLETYTRPNYLSIIIVYLLLLVFIFRLMGYRVWVETPMSIVLLVTFGGGGLLAAILIVCAYMFRKQWIEEIVVNNP
jgi:hypothetical protein